MENNKIVKYKEELLKSIDKSIKITSKLLSLDNHQLIPYYVKYRWGFCSPNKTILIEPMYSQVYLFSEELACVEIIRSYNEEDHNGYDWGYINKLNEIIIPFMFQSAKPFSNGFARVKKNEKWGLINKKGSQVLDFIYDEIAEFNNGFAEILFNGKVGLIDMYGKQTISPIYGSISHWVNGNFSVTLNEFFGQAGIIDLNEKVLVPLVHGGLVLIEHNTFRAQDFRGEEHAHYWENTIYDLFGNIIISTKNYEQVGAASEGLITVKLKGKWGCINYTGTVEIEFIFDEIFGFSKGLSPVKLNGKWGVISKEGKFIIPCIFNKFFRPIIDGPWEEYFSNGLIFAQIGNIWNLIDKSGQIVSEFKYEPIDHLKNGLIIVKSMNKYGYMDIFGNLVIPCIYEYVHSFSDGVARVYLNKKCGLINKQGNEIVPCIYDSIDNFSDDLAIINIDKNYGFIDKAGKVVIPIIYNKVDKFFKGIAQIYPIYGDSRFINKVGVQYWVD